MEGQGSYGSSDLMELSFPLTPWVGFVLAVLSLPHVFYFLVWTNPSPFMSMAKKVKVPALELFYKVSLDSLFAEARVPIIE